MKENTELQERLAVHAMVRLPRVTRRMWFHLDHYLHDWSIAPTYRFLARRSGCTIGRVRIHLARLEEEQIVSVFDGKRRCIRLLLRYPLPDSVPSGVMPTTDLPPPSFLPENSPLAKTRALLTLASLTEPTQRVWYHLDSFMERHGVAPTHRELGEQCKGSDYSVGRHLKYLQIARVIRRAYKRPRAIRLLLRYPEHLRQQPFAPVKASHSGPDYQSRIPFDLV